MESARDDHVPVEFVYWRVPLPQNTAVTLSPDVPTERACSASQSGLVFAATGDQLGETMLFVDATAVAWVPPIEVKWPPTYSVSVPPMAMLERTERQVMTPDEGPDARIELDQAEPSHRSRTP